MSGSFETELSPLKIIDHDHDEANGVYRLTIGREIIRKAYTETSTALDDNGDPVMETVPLISEDIQGTPNSIEEMFPDGVPPDFDESELTHTREKQISTEVPAEVVGVQDTTEYVFADDDPRWFDDDVRRDDNAVAQDQINDVKTALEAAAAEAAEAEREAAEHTAPVAQEPRKLPGIGQEL